MFSLLTSRRRLLAQQALLLTLSDPRKPCGVICSIQVRLSGLKMYLFFIFFCVFNEVFV